MNGFITVDTAQGPRVLNVSHITMFHANLNDTATISMTAGVAGTNVITTTTYSVLRGLIRVAMQDAR